MEDAKARTKQDPAKQCGKVLAHSLRIPVWHAVREQRAGHNADEAPEWDAEGGSGHEIGGVAGARRGRAHAVEGAKDGAENQTEGERAEGKRQD